MATGLAFFIFQTYLVKPQNCPYSVIHLPQPHHAIVVVHLSIESYEFELEHRVTNLASGSERIQYS